MGFGVVVGFRSLGFVRVGVESFFWLRCVLSLWFLVFVECGVVCGWRGGGFLFRCVV